jgi:hypothetical protein
MIHMYVTALSIQHVHNLVPCRLLVSIVCGDTPLFRRGVRVSLLHFLLNLIPGISTRCRTCKARGNSRIAPADPAAEESAHDGTDTRSHQPMFVFDRLCVSDLLVTAFPTRRFDRLGEDFGTDDLRAARGSEHPISSDGANRARRDCT